MLQLTSSAWWCLYYQQDPDQPPQQRMSSPWRPSSSPDEGVAMRPAPPGVISRVKTEVRRVHGEAQRWRGTVQEQRRHIYDRHTMLNWRRCLFVDRSPVRRNTADYYMPSLCVYVCRDVKMLFVFFIVRYVCCAEMSAMFCRNVREIFLSVFCWHFDVQPCSRLIDFLSTDCERCVEMVNFQCRQLWSFCIVFFANVSAFIWTYLAVADRWTARPTQPPVSTGLVN